MGGLDDPPAQQTNAGINGYFLQGNGGAPF